MLISIFPYNGIMAREMGACTCSEKNHKNDTGRREKMIKISVEPIGITIEAEDEQPLMASLAKAGIRIEAPCGGNQICGACRLWVMSGKVPATPHENIGPEDEKKGLRLACMAVPEGDVTIRLENNFAYDKQNMDQGRILGQTLKSGNGISNPAVKIDQGPNGFQLWYDNQAEPAALESWQPGDRPTGLAIDIGTTTMVISLVSLNTGAVLSSASRLNPQVAHGHDVLTRINYANTPEKIDEMGDLVQQKLNAMLKEACAAAGIRPREIIDVAIGANTTMLQMAAKMDCAAIGRAPFVFDIKGGESFSAAKWGLNVNRAARVYLPPVMHAFVGTDITAGLLLWPDFFDEDKSVLYLDMGTNGELCLNVKGNRFTTSTAAGPAFEGMGLSTGMRATDGAVEKVVCREGWFAFETIGDGPAKGICGSGIIDFLAVLLDSGYLEPSGRFSTPGSDDIYILEDEDQVKFKYGQDLYLTQKDIRQIQLAKGAVRTGIDLILEAGGITAGDLDKIFIAGGFGNYLRPAHMERIGLIPPDTATKIFFCGNASIDGSTALLADKETRTFIEKGLKMMTYVELASQPKFMKHFVNSLQFP